MNAMIPAMIVRAFILSRNLLFPSFPEKQEKPFHTGIYPYEQPIERPAVLVDADMSDIADAILYGTTANNRSSGANAASVDAEANEGDGEGEETPFFAHPTGDGLPVFNLVRRSTFW